MEKKFTITLWLNDKGIKEVEDYMEEPATDSSVTRYIKDLLIDQFDKEK